MEPVIAPRRKHRINRKTKLHLVFDEEARREYLKGFHKRKLERKRKAREELEEQLRLERKRIREEAKSQHKSLVKSYQSIPELEQQFGKEYEMDNATVSVLELDTDLLAETNFIIGRNKGKIEDEEEDSSERPDKKTAKELKKEIKKRSTAIVKNSKAFKIKNKLNRNKLKKKSLREKKRHNKIKYKGSKSHNNK